MRITALFLIFISVFGFAQNSEYPKDLFRSPLDIPIYLSGNFAELRKNHFHTGLDIKTKGVEGLKIYACADGWLRRAKKSPYGYGNVLYIDHPEGYTTVYAHLQKFSSKIEAAYKAAQKEKQIAHLDMYPDSGAVWVKKGEVIALSGNSGSSGGPHLHFEIRERKTEKPLNPYLFGFIIKDNIKPDIRGIYLYGFSNDSIAPSLIRELNSGSRTGIISISNQTITSKYYGNMALAVHSTDRLNGSGNICGIYNLKLLVNDELIFEQEMEKLDFNTNRYMNAHTDYDIFMDKKRSIHKSYIEPNNQLEIYKHVKNRGIFYMSKNSSADIEYQIRDVAGNLSILKFKLKAGDQKLDTVKKNNVLPCCVPYEIEKEDFVALFKPGTVYRNTSYNFSQSDENPKYCESPVYTIRNDEEPVHQHYEIRIKTDLNEAEKEKALIVAYDNGSIWSVGGEYKNGWVVADVRNFGGFTVMTDFTPPVIKAMNFYEGKNMGSNTEIAISCTDNLSGLESYSFYIDDEWVPMYYNPKRRKYYIEFKEIELSKGQHKLKFEAIDKKGNKSIKEWTITR